MKVVTIVLAGDDKQPSSFDLALIEGCEPLALAEAVKRRLPVGCDDFYLTQQSDPASLVFPLTASLPDGLKLYLHVNDTTTKTTTAMAQPTQQRASVAAAAAAAASNVEIIDYKENGEREAKVEEELEKNGNNYDKVPTKEDVKEEECPPGNKPSFNRFGLYAKRYNPFGKALHSSKVDKAFKDLHFFNQLGTDLANERTLLAWIRTLLSCVRTVFSYEKQVLSSGLTTLMAATMMTATLLLLSGLNAGYRYVTTRRLLMTEEKPKTYNRFSLMPFILLAVSIAFLTSIETYLGHWDSE